MEVRLARKYGFCFGVEDAIETAQRALNANTPGKVVSLGPVIHNRQVVENLERAGLDQSGDLKTLAEGSTVLIRSHGVGPDVYEQAKHEQIIFGKHLSDS